jgi:uncharacterized protein YebE (UPF0316 family)
MFDTLFAYPLLPKNKYGATSSVGEGVEGGVSIVETFIGRKDSQYVQVLINSYDASAFYVISDVRSVRHGIFLNHSPSIFARDQIGK